MKKHIYILFLVLSFTFEGFSQVEITKNNEEASEARIFNEEDYNKMVTHYSKNVMVTKALDQKMTEGDAHAKKVMHVLKISYEEAIACYKKKEVDLMINTYYLTLEMEKSFSRINKKIAHKGNSLNHSVQQLEKE